MLTIPVALLILCGGEPSRTCNAHRGHAHAQPTAAENFRVRWLGVAADPRFSVACEEMLLHLRTEWFDLDDTEWRPRCEIVIHKSQESYVQAVGAAGRSTVGSSRVQILSGAVVERRIDLVGNAALQNLRHELIHVLFAERFSDRPAPRWAEEGLALLTDTKEKQELHRRDLLYAIRNDETIPLAKVLTAEHYPDGWGRAVFYGQSLVLVEFLVQRDSPRAFIRFIDAASKSGYEQALRQVYGIQDIGALRHLWRTSLHDAVAEADERRSVTKR